MDNLCHTLVGAALAEAGLKRRTSLGYATLLIGANLPDVDVVSIPFGSALTARRGWTHGLLALALLPMLLTMGMAWWARRRARQGRSFDAPFLPREILLLAFVSILTHPVLDFMNDYGMRWLMPFSGRWFYGDALFIVDPWLWIALAVGVIASRRMPWRPRWSPRPARVALVLSAAYITSMVGATAWLRARVARQLDAAGVPSSHFMVAPVPLDPLARRVVADAGDRYRFGTVALPDGRLLLDVHVVEKGSGAVIRAAARTPAGRAFLSWARFPFFLVERTATATLVRIGDARYTTMPTGGFGTVELKLPAPVGGSSE